MVFRRDVERKEPETLYSSEDPSEERTGASIQTQCCGVPLPPIVENNRSKLDLKVMLELCFEGIRIHYSNVSISLDDLDMGPLRSKAVSCLEILRKGCLHDHFQDVIRYRPMSITTKRVLSPLVLTTEAEAGHVKWEYLQMIRCLVCPGRPCFLLFTEELEVHLRTRGHLANVVGKH